MPTTWPHQTFRESLAVLDDLFDALYTPKTRLLHLFLCHPLAMKLLFLALKALSNHPAFRHKVCLRRKGQMDQQVKLFYNFTMVELI